MNKRTLCSQFEGLARSKILRISQTILYNTPLYFIPKLQLCEIYNLTNKKISNFFKMTVSKGRFSFMADTFAYSLRIFADNFSLLSPPQQVLDASLKIFN